MATPRFCAEVKRMARMSGPSSLNSHPQAAPDTEGEGRIAALDGLRAAAMLLGVCLHGSVSYMSGRMPGLIWVVRDSTCHSFFDFLFWWLHAFRLPLFFFLAGFFAALVEVRCGPGGLLAQRARRLLVPFLGGCLVIVPLTFYIWAAGWLVSGHCTVKQILAVKFRPVIQGELYGPLHLWFLEDLFLLNLIFCGYRRLFPQPAVPTQPALGGIAGWGQELPLWLAIPTTIVLAVNLQPVVAHHNSFVPDGWRLLYYGLFFAAGVAIYPQRKDLPAICRSWGGYLALSAPLAVLLLPLLHRHLEQPHEWQTRWVLAATLSLLAWLSLFGLLGLGLRYGHAQRDRLRYLADASYWVYLCHLPLVGLIQLDLVGVAMPAGVKFLLVVGLTTWLALTSYHTLVRYTFLGACLHGRRNRPDSPHRAAAVRPRLQQQADRSLTLTTRRAAARPITHFHRG
jgi:glucan biosynthesis protein C